MTGHPLPQPDHILLHATCVSIDGRGILLQGPPGSGKSDLALRLIDQPGMGIDGQLKRAQLVVDDQVWVTRREQRLIATAPETLAGKLEIRGLGILAVPNASEVELALGVRLSPAAAIERMPGDAHLDILGLSLPLVLIDPACASAPGRIRTALDWLEARSNHIAQPK